jgi:(R,R)-butanediol dehydrogenase/meso-butanediol dehydrogenase/diacetyl reductase
MTDGHAASFPAGSVLGHEFAGEVVAIGAGVERYKLGDTVAGLAVAGCGRCANCIAGDPMWCEKGLIPAMGGFGQYTRVNALAAIKLPATLSLEDGALIEPLAVGLHGVTLAALGPGARVLILDRAPSDSPQPSGRGASVRRMCWSRRAPHAAGTMR